MKSILITLAGILCFVLLGWTLWAGGVFVAPIVGQGEVYKTINSKTTRLAAYNNFYDLCASVQLAEDQLDAQYKLQKLGTSDQRVVTVIAGLEGTRARAIRQYNIDSQKSYTIAQFKDAGLPYQLSYEAYTGKEHTSCGI